MNKKIKREFEEGVPGKDPFFPEAAHTPTPETYPRFCEVHEMVHQMEDRGYWQTWNQIDGKTRRVWVAVWTCPEWETDIKNKEALK